MGDRGLEGGDGIFGTGFSSSIEGLGGTGGLMTLKPTEINKSTMAKIDKTMCVKSSTICCVANMTQTIMLSINMTSHTSLK